MAYDYPIIVIGAGAGGLVVAIGAAKAGKKVLLIERGNFGGDCTNYGCIPSKSLIASAEVAHLMHRGPHYGIEGKVEGFSSSEALKRTQRIVNGFRHEEGPEALAKHNVDTLVGEASFLDSHTIRVTFSSGEHSDLSAGQIILATGSHPRLPKLEGLQETPYLTNETIFSLTNIPNHLVVLGGGPIGTELSHAFRRLGAKVTLVQHSPHLLTREEPESQQTIEMILKEEGVNLLLQHEPQSVKQEGDGITLSVINRQTKEEKMIQGSHLFVATGREVSLHALQLEKADVQYTPHGVPTDRYGRTNQKHIWAVGDVAGPPYFTHMAEYQARRVLFNLLFPWPFRKKSPKNPLIPRVTYTDPEIAAVGLTEKEAAAQYGKGKIAVYLVPFDQVDRAVCAGRTEGFVKVVTKKWSSHILGATIVAPRAGEMLMELVIAMDNNIPLRRLASIIHPYPTYSLAIRKAADFWLTQTLLPTLTFWRKRP